MFIRSTTLQDSYDHLHSHKTEWYALRCCTGSAVVSIFRLLSSGYQFRGLLEITEDELALLFLGSSRWK